jgi:hypothetical protein
MPISLRQKPETAFLSQNLDQQVTDHGETAANHHSSAEPDRQGNGADRLLAAHREGLDKPNSTPQGPVIGLIGRFQSTAIKVCGRLLLTPLATFRLRCAGELLRTRRSLSITLGPDHRTETRLLG